MFVTFKHYNTIHSINVSHIIAAEYQEPRQYSYDDDTGETYDPPRTVPASLKISTEQLVQDEVFRYNGDMIGAVPVSRNYILSGDLATSMYNMLQTIAYK